MNYKQYKIVGQRYGVAFRWHVYTDKGQRLTALGFRSVAAAKRFCRDRDALPAGEYAIL